MTQNTESTSIVLSGIQKRGTVVYRQAGVDYVETVIASNDRIGKQIVHCRETQPDGTKTVLYRIEYYQPHNGHKAMTNVARYTRATAFELYKSL